METLRVDARIAAEVVWRMQTEIDRLERQADKLWNILSWIDTSDPEITAAAEDKFEFSLHNRIFAAE
jgi:hypothetical protein